MKILLAFFDEIFASKLAFLLAKKSSYDQMSNRYILAFDKSSHFLALPNVCDSERIKLAFGTNLPVSWAMKGHILDYFKIFLA